MKNVILSALAICLMVSASYGQEFPKMDGSPMDAAYYPPRAAFRNFAKTDAERKAGEPIIRVVYSRPQKKGRDIFGDLQKFGEWWRIGANEATEILLMKDVKVGGKTLKAGRYTMYAMLQENEWDIHFSSDLDGWGHYAFNPDESSLANIKVATQATSGTVEAMGIFFEKTDNGADMVIGWDDTMVRVPFEL